MNTPTIPTILRHLLLVLLLAKVYGAAAAPGEAPRPAKTRPARERRAVAPFEDPTKALAAFVEQERVSRARIIPKH